MKKKFWNLRIGFALCALLLLVAILAPWLAPYNPYHLSLPDELCRPNARHWLGCDTYGSDIFSILLYGTRLSLSLSLSVTVINLVIGLVIGSIAGYCGGLYDIVLMRGLDILFAFPGLILAIAIASILGPSPFNLVLALIITGWAGYARLIRGEILAIKQKEFVEAARALGVRPTTIVVRHLWPNLLPSLAVAVSFGIAHTIVAEASLSFLGIGVPPGTPSWGALLNYGRDVLVEAPHVALFPGLALLIVVLAFNCLGEGLRQKWDPRSR